MLLLNKLLLIFRKLDESNRNESNTKTKRVTREGLTNFYIMTITFTIQ